jgi:hypothetical protein
MVPATEAENVWAKQLRRVTPRMSTELKAKIVNFRLFVITGSYGKDMAGKLTRAVGRAY